MFGRLEKREVRSRISVCIHIKNRDDKELANVISLIFLFKCTSVKAKIIIMGYCPCKSNYKSSCRYFLSTRRHLQDNTRIPALCRIVSWNNGGRLEIGQTSSHYCESPVWGTNYRTRWVSRSNSCRRRFLIDGYGNVSTGTIDRWLALHKLVRPPIRGLDGKGWLSFIITKCFFLIMYFRDEKS
jgi:hypothetical protein